MSAPEHAPHCIYQPRTAADVALAIIILRQTGCPFAVKSGGHGRYPGESTVEGGVLIDLVKLNHIEVSTDRTTVTVGPGNRWLVVYTAIQPLGLIVVGGRDADVGVGGFLLGGGISFHSSLHGWGSDNIQSYEVVLANGTIVTASKTKNSDLFHALRGGGGNFGIVTSFTLDAYPYNGIWGGVRDLKTSVILTHGYHMDQFIWSLDLEYCEAVDQPPTSLQPFMDIPALLDGTGKSHVSTLALAMSRQSNIGHRNSYWVLAAKLDIRILEFYADIFVEECSKHLDIPGFNPCGDIQIITGGMLKGMAKNGGNVLGLSKSQEPLLIFNPCPRWKNKEDDGTILALFQKIIRKVKTRATELGLDHEYLYMNYASQCQDVVAGYGADEKEFMLQVSKEFDSDAVFQKLRAGGFKLRGAPQVW
ncbi:FAD-binding domain-containing protein [Sporormia fimetaria CBS 119925]|uniref:FAD-binding domain-containing protein n=1 Tax=Sporormia fimetaria CBS 119925 TaxID=1340428 RepID=A0A6A6V5Q8_9PLEO|nr:FAD-binding domain-containing protein [Sporormia fimetaria CBS 119925]